MEWNEDITFTFFCLDFEVGFKAPMSITAAFAFSAAVINTMNVALLLIIP